MKKKTQALLEFLELILIFFSVLSSLVDRGALTTVGHNMSATFYMRFFCSEDEDEDCDEDYDEDRQAKPTAKLRRRQRVAAASSALELRLDMDRVLRATLDRVRLTRLGVARLSWIISDRA